MAFSAAGTLSLEEIHQKHYLGNQAFFSKVT